MYETSCTKWYKKGEEKEKKMGLKSHLLDGWSFIQLAS
jgi:hypothetical protein